jgi:predicted nicotinamide N-methyase
VLTDEGARSIRENLEKRYDLELAKAQVRNITLKILQLKDMETYLIRNIESEALSLENFPFWTMVWEGALVLADFLVNQEPVPGRRILELGSGLGFVGLFTAARGHEVTLTDNSPDALAFAQFSAHYNKLSNATVKFLDWEKPDLPQPYDWIVGSDILYEPKNFGLLLDIFARYLAPEGRIYLTHGLKGPGAKTFFEMAKRQFAIRYREKNIRSEGETKKVLFFELLKQ